MKDDKTHKPDVAFERLKREMYTTRRRPTPRQPTGNKDPRYQALLELRESMFVAWKQLERILSEMEESHDPK